MTPTPPTGPAMSRSTPVPANGSLQELAKRRKAASSEVSVTGRLTASAEGTAGLLRHEDLVARPVPEGLLIEGKVFDGRDRSGPWTALAVLEVFAKRRDGGVASGLVILDRGEGTRAPFARVLSAPSNPSDPASLRPETAGGRFHLRPEPPQFHPEDRDYLKYVECLRYWVKPLANPKASEDDLVEVHVLNSCAWGVPYQKTWFAIRIQKDISIEAWDTRIYGLFTEDVPARGELQQAVPAKVPHGRYVRVEPWRLQQR